MRLADLAEREDYDEIVAGREQTRRMMRAYTEAAERNDQSVRYMRLWASGR